MIIVPTLLLLATLVTLLVLCLMRYCPEKKRARTTAPQRYHSSSNRHNHRHHLQGIDGEQACISLVFCSVCLSGNKQIHLSALLLSGLKAPNGINPLEHEELPMSIQQVQQNIKPTLAAVPPASTQWHHGAFSQVNALPLSFSIKTSDTVSLYRARMDNRDVILRVLKGNLSCTKTGRVQLPTAPLQGAKLPFLVKKE